MKWHGLGVLSEKGDVKQVYLWKLTFVGNYWGKYTKNP